jgi:hypothetical protein
LRNLTLLKHPGGRDEAPRDDFVSHPRGTMRMGIKKQVLLLLALAGAGSFTTLAQAQEVELASYSFVREVAMFYRLDLAENNSLAGSIAAVVRSSEEALRQCYVDRLDDEPDLRGQLALSFELSKTTGNMRKVKSIGGTLKDPKLISCVKERLAKLTFELPRTISGRLDYTFDAKERPAPARAP